MDLASVDKLLTTTRAVRKRLDLEKPVHPAILQECMEIAIQAPTGSNSQGWQFLFGTDSGKKLALAELYRRAFDPYVNRADRPDYGEEDPRSQQMPHVLESAKYLAAHLQQVPVHLIPCVDGRVENAPAWAQASVYGSILPAVWSFMLAARARGLGTAWTTLHLPFEKEAAELLGIPESMTQCALVPVAYFQGEDFKPAKRLPVREVVHWNAWGQREA
ncbi:MAG: nitroreductase family protein [Myxococcota bacterium]|nr:nitroreductase family protein [Myxococcota bacterium]